MPWKKSKSKGYIKHVGDTTLRVQCRVMGKRQDRRWCVWVQRKYLGLFKSFERAKSAAEQYVSLG
jgi:hypothetical protein